MVEGERHQGLLKYDEVDECLKNDITNDMNWIPILAKLYDLVIFDAFVPHRSGVNETNNQRDVFYLTYNERNSSDFYE